MAVAVASANSVHQHLHRVACCVERNVCMCFDHGTTDVSNHTVLVPLVSALVVQNSSMCYTPGVACAVVDMQ